MKTSELINILKESMDIHGDKEILIKHDAGLSGIWVSCDGNHISIILNLDKKQSNMQITLEEEAEKVINGLQSSRCAFRCTLAQTIKAANLSQKSKLREAFLKEWKIGLDLHDNKIEEYVEVGIEGIITRTKPNADPLIQALRLIHKSTGKLEEITMQLAENHRLDQTSMLIALQELFHAMKQQAYQIQVMETQLILK